ncbi:MAG: hypothetical protein ABI824_13210, partial [Acidobacteriota bacterium]
IAALANRRSAEKFTPISTGELATWLHYATSVQAVNSEDPNRQRRYVASFGALHPAHIVVGSPNGTWNAYVPERHALGDLHVDPVTATALRAKAQQCFQTDDATLVALIGDFDLAAHYYLNPLSLMLRDAGVLFGHAALVASALGLGFRILGSTGSPLVERLVMDLPFRPVATGLAWIGGSSAA